MVRHFSHFVWLASVCLMPAAVSVRAQYAGGAGDGFAVGEQANTRLDGRFTSGVAFAGGNSDGFAVADLANNRLDSTVIAAQAFAGGNGDGFAVGESANTRIDGIITAFFAFGGGSGDGFSSREIDSVPLPPFGAVNPMFAGGSGDGFAVGELANARADGNLTASFAFTGGGGDGFAVADLANANVSGNPAVSFAFTGGGGDGFSRAGVVSLQLPAFAMANQMFTGGGGDGFNIAEAANVQMGSGFVTLASGPYFGGGGDGFASLTINNAPLIFNFTTPVTFSQWLTAAFTPAQIAAGQSGPLANPSGDGVNNLLKYAYGADPSVAGSANGKLPRAYTAGGYLQLFVTKAAYAESVSFQVDAANAVNNASAWSTSGLQILTNTSTALVVRDTVPMVSTAMRYLRVTVTLIGPPVMVTQPQSVSVMKGSNAVFSSLAGGGLP